MAMFFIPLTSIILSGQPPEKIPAASGVSNFVRITFGAIGASISGAGPPVLFWTQADATGAVMQRLRREAEGWADVRRTQVSPRGARVEL
jgi:homoserine kinase